MLPAIDLNHEACRAGHEITDEGSDRELAIEAGVRDLAGGEAGPQPALGIGGIQPELAGAGSWAG
jgi:hypothetical protein